MGHIRIFTQPISWLDYLSVFLITHHTRWLSELRFLILRFFRIQPFTILIVWFPFIVHKKVDTRCQKVNCRCLEKLITTASAFSLSFLQGFQQCLSRLTGHPNSGYTFSEWDSLSAVFHIHKTDGAKLVTFGCFAKFLILPSNSIVLNLVFSNFFRCLIISILF